MFRWEIHCWDNFDSVSGGQDLYTPERIRDVVLFIYAENEESAIKTARTLVTRHTCKAVECVEELPDPETVTISVKTGDGSLRTITKPASMTMAHEVVEGMSVEDEALAP